MNHFYSITLLVGVSVWMGGVIPAFGQKSGDSCVRCHGDMELLRQNFDDPAAAAAAWVSDELFEASSHGDLGCADCHSGFDQHPHPSTGRETQRCASCHEDEATGHASSIHADLELMNQAGETCSSCHGVHDVAVVDYEFSPADLDDRCARCHEAESPTTADRHQSEIGCSHCHGSHDIGRLQGDTRETNVRNILERCRDCHEEQWDAHANDIHGQALADWEGPTPVTTGESVPPTCTTCHQPHDMKSVEHAEFASWMTTRCGECHEDAAQSATDTYHIRARFLGSDVAASCADCHGSHGIFPSDDPLSLMSDANRLETCRTCHAKAEAGFELYQPHPDPRDRAKNPYVFYSFWFMNLLLAGVLGVFLLHTLAWWIRIGLDLRAQSREGGPR